MPGHQGGDVGVAGNTCEEDAKVSRAHVLREAQERKADESTNAARDQDGRSQVILVSQVGKSEHEDHGEDLGWCNQTLRRTHAETHAVPQNYGEEVCDRVGDARSAHKDHAKPPALDISCMGEKPLPAESVGKDAYVSLKNNKLGVCQGEPTFQPPHLRGLG